MYVVNNTFVNVPFIPIIVSTTGHSGNYISDVVIENNIFKNSCHTSVCSGVLSLTKGTGSNVTYGGHGSGANVIVDYNSIYGGVSSIDFSGPGNTTILSYANFKTACPGCQSNDAGSPGADQLLDSSMKLQSTSPLIDKATSQSSVFTTDFLGISRPQGSAWDMGAFESGYTGSGTGTVSCATTNTCKAGDFNQDGYVNTTDFSYMNSVWNTNDAKADLNKDGKVNTLDFSIMVKNWTPIGF
jgi:hypothetical protein